MPYSLCCRTDGGRTNTKPCGDSDCFTESHSIPDTKPGTHSNSYTNSHSYSNPYPYTYSGAGTGKLTGPIL